MQKKKLFSYPYLLAILAFFMPALAHAENVSEKIDAAFGNATGWFVNLIFWKIPGIDFPWIVIWLIGGGVITTLYFGFIQIRGFRHAISLVRGDYSDKNAPGEVSHFQALATALSGTVGLGNIAGVSVAVSLGGAGATFWMILAGLAGMASKFTECTLGVHYREEHADGTVSGGAMYYITKGFKELGLPAGKVLAIAFAIMTILASFGGGNMFQANQMHKAITGVVGDFQGIWTGIVIAILVFIVIIGGIKSIANVTDKLVPFMGVLYVAMSLIIIFMNIDKIGGAISDIFEGAFTGKGIVGGALGTLIQGMKRATFSNEAGVGSAAIAHAAVKTKHPVTEGYVSLLEPFIDTVVICTMTALVIGITGQLMVDAETGNYILTEAGNIQNVAGAEPGVNLAIAAYSAQFGFFKYFMVFAIVLFAFSTMISWSYYGAKAFQYIFGHGKLQVNIFNTIFCLMIIVGAASSLGNVIDFSDASLFAMAIFNLIGVYFLMRIVKRELVKYNDDLKSGKIKKMR